MKLKIDDYKGLLSRFSKKEKKGKQPRVKTVKQRTANILVVGSLLGFFLLGLVGSLLSMGVANQIQGLNNSLVQLEGKLSEVGQVSDDLDVSKVQFYMSNFVYTYVNVDLEKLDERRQALSQYFSFKTDVYGDEVKANRVLKTQRLISVEKADGYHLAITRANYELSGENKQMLLAVPFQIADGVLAIVSPPYALAEDLYQGRSQAFERRDVKDLIKLSETDSQSIRDFLPIFFDKYAASNETDLKLLMKTPFLMGGSYQVHQIDDSSLLLYQEEGKKVIQVSVQFKEISTGAIHAENFTLYLSQQDTGWYVDEMYHYFKP